jgi:hypothetical protein
MRHSLCCFLNYEATNRRERRVDIVSYPGYLVYRLKLWDGRKKTNKETTENCNKKKKKEQERNI